MNFVRFTRGIALRSIVLIVVGGSQIGMLMVAAIYVQMGRVESMFSPEAVLGILAIALALLVMRVHPLTRRRDYIFPWLLAFLAYCSVSELLRPDLRVGNVTTFISIGAYYLIGRTIGTDVFREQDGRIPWTPALLCIYLFWYLAMLVFLIRGDLGFYGQLPNSDLARLQFSDGFRATEIAIHVGFQLPVLLYILLQVPSVGQRIVAALLLGCATALVFATVSAAALVAMVIVLLVFLFARTGLSLRTLAIAGAGGFIVGAVMLSVFNEGIVAATRAKLQDYVVGEGTRAFIYTELVNDMINEPLGIGKGRFVETNNLSWRGESVYPHQNLLGIGAELGVPAMLLFAGFIITASVVLARCAWTHSQTMPRGLKMIAAVALAMFLYQQFRGLFQDTWAFRETYFWLGLAASITSLRRESGAVELEPARP